jgi:copper(I)-binding protein
MQKRSLALSALVVVLVSGAAEAGGLTVTDGWIRALPSNVPSGGYFHLRNGSGRQVVLTGASSPACGMLMLHKSETTSGMASMSDVTSVPVVAGAELSFSPGGYHLMCMKPTSAIKPGNKVPVTLVFEDGSKIRSDFVVRNASGR